MLASLLLLSTVQATPTVQQSLKLVDILTLIALIAGPATAVGLQLWIERRRERRRAKSSVLETLMSFRRRLIQAESVAALNRVQLVFHDAPDVLKTHTALIAHMNHERTLPESERQQGWNRREDLLIELITAMAYSVGYRFNHTEIKGGAYLPQGWLDEETYTQEIRARLTAAFTRDGAVKVHLDETH